MKKPFIGVSSSILEQKMQSCCSVSHTYSYSIIAAGGLPLVVPQIDDLGLAEEILDKLDGLLLTGGEDILPLHYGEQPIKDIQKINPDRDLWEMALCRKALENNLPIFGICRGVQLLNVTLGGSLYQNLNSQKKTDYWHMVMPTAMCHPVHGVTIKEGTLLSRCFDDNHIFVNSFHNQGIKDLGEGLVVNAMSDDGLIEGLEFPGKKYVMGVQWHPEALVQKFPQTLKIFSCFIDACR